jgi:RNA polymerase sigma-70 factor (ECF subfamily)
VKRPKNSRPPSTDQAPEAASRDRRASVDRLLAEHLPGLTAFVRLRLGPLIRANESCADIVQSACREVLAHADRFRFDGDGKFRNWLYTTALRKITDKQRYYLADKRRPPRRERQAGTSVASDEQLADCYQTAFTSPTRAAIRREDVEGLERAFDRLSEEDRELIVMARIVGLGVPEIAEQTGVAAGTIRVRLSRALARLATEMRRLRARDR